MTYTPVKVAGYSSLQMRVYNIIEMYYFSANTHVYSLQGGGGVVEFLEKSWCRVTSVGLIDHLCIRSRA